MTSFIFKAKISLSLITLTILSTGCGTGTEPLSALNSSDLSTLPQLSIPFATSGTNAPPVSSLTPFSTSNDGYRFNTLAVSGSYSILAPYSGLVTSTDSSSVTIYHHARLSTQLSRINPTVVPGAVVTAGTVIGTATLSASSSSVVSFKVYLDGSVVCPYFFLTGGDSSQKTWINALTLVGGVGHCN